MADNGLRGFFGKHFGKENVLWVAGEGPEPDTAELKRRAAERPEVTKRYKIERRSSGRVTAVVKFYGKDYQGFENLNPRLDLWNHSPDGFEFGYSGSGPAQLALALLADALGDDRFAVALHQDFKFRVVANWKRSKGYHEITAETIRAICAEMCEPPDDPPGGWPETGAAEYGDPFADADPEEPAHVED